jgi:primosomal protein N' (replication factor Y)
VAQLLRDGGGVLRVTPNDDLLPIVVAAAASGPALVVHPSVIAARALAGAARRVGLSVALMPEEWARAAAGGVDVVIGGRAAAWAPGEFGCVVVLDEHDEALQEERSPTWHARDVLVERASRSDVPCLLVSPCPSVSALAWSGRRWMRPTVEAERAGWPVVDIVDRSDDEPWRRSLVTTQLIAHLRDHSTRVVCVHNVAGHARLLACRMCRSLLRCERCDAAVSQEDQATLRCHRCGTTRPPVCQSCGSAALANVRPGVARLREELEAAAGRPVAAVTGTSGDPPPDVDVLVGTEAVLHRARSADVVVFLDIDAELLAPRYRAAEQAMALLVRAARVVGPRSELGRILVQTFLPRHDVLQAALLADPGRLAKVEAERRRELMLPPFSALARVSGSGAAEFVAQLTIPAGADGDGYLLRAESWDELGAVLASATRPKGARVRVEVDPPRR